MPSHLLSDLRLFLILIFLSIILLIFDNLGFLNLPKSGVQFITVPIQYGLYKTSTLVTKQFEFIVLARRSAQEKDALTKQMAQVLLENATLRRKLAETEGFLNQQRALSDQTFTKVAARPIGFSRYLLIDKGSDDGIKVGQPLIYEANYLGKVVEVSSKRSQIMLPSDPDSHISAFAGNTNSRAKGVLNGQFGQDLLFDKILHEEPLNKDDLVYTEGTEVEIPRGLILGQVAEVLDRENEVFKQAKVKNIFDAQDLDIVFVIVN